VFAFHPEVDTLFRSAGWHPERRVDVATWHTSLSGQGFQLFPAAERILGCVGGLTVRGPARAETRWCAREIVFDPVRASAGQSKHFREWEELVGQKLYPLADLTPRLGVVVAEDGTIFAGIKCLFYRYGGTFEEAMMLYFLGLQHPVQCTWCD
jgi:hypothetical protein